MLWLTWHMWILLLLAFMGGVVTGWVLRSKSDQPEPLRELSAPPAPAPTPVSTPAAPSATVATSPSSTAPADLGSDETAQAAPNPASEAVKTGKDSDTAEPEAQAEVGAEPDDLTQIKGLGPRAAEKLNALGVTTLAEIARWTADDIARIDADIQGRGRIEREAWVEQARDLATH